MVLAFELVVVYAQLRRMRKRTTPLVLMIPFLHFFSFAPSLLTNLYAPLPRIPSDLFTQVVCFFSVLSPAFTLSRASVLCFPIVVTFLQPLCYSSICSSTHSQCGFLHARTPSLVASHILGTEQTFNIYSRSVIIHKWTWPHGGCVVACFVCRT